MAANLDAFYCLLCKITCLYLDSTCANGLFGIGGLGQVYDLDYSTGHHASHLAYSHLDRSLSTLTLHLFYDFPTRPSEDIDCFDLAQHRLVVDFVAVIDY